MKILQALVSYLALSALPLAFHPGLFAFAYPLAAVDYYDGYVDATQNHYDSALIKREHGDIIEPRQVEALIPLGPIILIVVAEIALTVAYISQDNPVRGNDAEFLVVHFD
jgi:hypothetical protein